MWQNFCVMTSIFKCFSFLRIPLKFTVEPVLSKYTSIEPPKKIISQKGSTPFGVVQYILPLYQSQIKSSRCYKDLMVPTVLMSIPIYKTQRLYCTKVISKRFRTSRKTENKDKSKRDETCGENCVSIETEKPKKKIKTDTDLKFIVNLNNLVHEMVRGHACRKMEQINKLHNFIFKPVNCASCISKKKDIRNDKIDQQKRSYSVSAVKRKLFPNHASKKSELKQLKVPFKTETLVLPFILNRAREKIRKTLFVRDTFEVTKGGIVPLYLLVKSNSRRTKTHPISMKKFQYRVGTNHVFVPLDRKLHSLDALGTESKRFMLSSAKSTDSFFTNKYPLPAVESESVKAIKPKIEMKTKFQENFLRPSEERNFYYGEKTKNDQELNSMLADVVTKVLTPLLHKEYTKYSEVKKAIERLEKKVENYLEKQTNLSDDNLNRSLANLYSLLMRQNQPDSKNEEIKDPSPNIEIKDPTCSIKTIRDPRNRDYNITLPSRIKDKVTEPHRIDAIFTKDCGDDKKKNDRTKNDVCHSNSTGNKKESCEKVTDLCKSNKKDEDPSCFNHKQKKETKICYADETCRKMIKPEPMNVAFTPKAQLPCKTDNASACNTEAKSNCSSEPFSSAVKGSVCSETVNDIETEIYKKKDFTKKEIIGSPNQTCPLEIMDPCPSKVTGSCKAEETKTVCSAPTENFLPTCDQLNKKRDDCCEKRAADAAKYEEVKQSLPKSQRVEKNKPMGPSEITCEREVLTPRKCCEEVSLCEKSTVKVLESKCEIDQPPARQRADTKEKRICNQIPMSPDCPLKLNMEEKKPVGSYASTPVQKSCDAYSHEPKQPFNSCKPKCPAIPKEVPQQKTFKNQLNLIEKPDCMQTPCPTANLPERKTVIHQYQEAKSEHTPSSLPSSLSNKEGFISYDKPDPSQKVEEMPVNNVKKEPEKPKMEVRKPDTMPSCSATPESYRTRQPRQAQKKTWIPFKILSEKPKIKKCKSQPTTSCPPNQQHRSDPDLEVVSRKTPNLTGNLPSKSNEQKGLMGNCKGFLRNVCSVFCPGKGKSKKNASSLIRYQSLPSLTQGRIELPCCLLPGSADNYRPQKQIHTLFAYKTKTKNRYPWNQDKEQISNYVRTYFSTNSAKMGLLSPRLHLLRSTKFELQRNIPKKSKRKTLTFRLVNFKHFSGSSTNNFSHRKISQNLRYTDTLEVQKRKYSGITTENIRSNNKKVLGLCDGIPRKNNNRNKYPWKRSETQIITCTYECYLTKKSFENVSISPDNNVNTKRMNYMSKIRNGEGNCQRIPGVKIIDHPSRENDQSISRGEKTDEKNCSKPTTEANKIEHKSCTSNPKDLIADPCSVKRKNIMEYFSKQREKIVGADPCSPILEQGGQITNERECYRPKTEEEKKTYKACDGAQSTKDESCLKMTVNKEEKTEDPECYRPETAQKEKKYKSCNGEKPNQANPCSEATGGQEYKKVDTGQCKSIMDKNVEKYKLCDAQIVKEENKYDTQCYKPITVEEKKKYKSCDGKDSTKGNPCSRSTGSQEHKKDEVFPCKLSKEEEVTKKNSCDAKSVDEEKKAHDQQCFKPKTVEEKKKYKSCNREDSTKGTPCSQTTDTQEHKKNDDCKSNIDEGVKRHNVCDAKNVKEEMKINDAQCYRPKIVQGKKNYKSCNDGDSTNLNPGSETTDKPGCAKEKKRDDNVECFIPKTEEQKKKYRSCDAADNSNEDSCGPVKNSSKRKQTGNNLCDNPKSNSSDPCAKFYSTNKIGNEIGECLIEKKDEEFEKIKTSENSKENHLNPTKQLEGDKEPNAEKSKSSGKMYFRPRKGCEEYHSTDNPAETSRRLKDKGTSSMTALKEDETTVNVQESSGSNLLTKKPSKFSLAENAEHFSKNVNVTDFEGLACIVEVPLTKRGVKHRTEIRISCVDKPDQSLHKQGGSRDLQISRKPHEIAEVQKELKNLRTCSDDQILFCKAIRTGQTEILICKTKEQWESSNIEEENVEKIYRIVKGRLIKDRSNKDVLVCQEVKLINCDQSNEKQEKQMKEILRRARSPTKPIPIEVIISNRLLCFEKIHKGSDKRELECRMVKVKELVGCIISSIQPD